MQPVHTSAQAMISMGDRDPGRPFILGLSAALTKQQLGTADALAAASGQNTGNLAFHVAIDRQLGGNLDVLDWGSPARAINRQPGTGVLPCANQLGKHADLGNLADKFGTVERPLVAIGLGAQSPSTAVIPSVPDGTLRWVEQLVRHAPSDHPNLAVRGEFTRRVLEHYGFAEHVTVLGCPSLFLDPHRDLGQRIKARWDGNPRRIAIAAGNHAWPRLARLEASLTRLMAPLPGAYIVQHPIEMLRLVGDEHAELTSQQFAAIRDYCRPDLTLGRFADWAATHACRFGNIATWIHHLRGFDFVIGTRIHGVMLALQAGIPALCITHDSRTTELCETMCLPHVDAAKVADGIRPEDLERLFVFDADAFDHNRARLANDYAVFLARNRLRPAVELTRLC